MLLELIIFLVGAFFFALLLFIISFAVTFRLNMNLVKFDWYECGFKAFDNTRQPIHLQYFLLVFLFVLFDLETVYLVPWLTNFFYFGFGSLWLMLTFLGLLFLSYVYELRLGLFNF